MERFKGSCGVICEFNPFHHGHAHLLSKAKEKYEYVFGIMSGNLVQRGGNACAEKYARAASAIECGFDGVVELPFPYCGTSARDFAAAGVHIAEEMGLEAIIFGAEDKENLLKAAELLCSPEFESNIENKIKENKVLSYPKAVENTLKEVFGENAAKSLCRPNNILAMEYIKAAKRRSLIKIEIIDRNDCFSSAGSIRKVGVDPLLLPEAASKFYKKTVADGVIFDYCAAAAKLYTGDKAILYGIDESLAGRITKACRVAGNAKELIALCVSANDTEARVRRAMVSILFGVTKYAVAEKPSYTTVLAFNEKGGKLIKEIRKHTDFPIETKPASLCGNKQADFSLRCERVLRQIYGTPDPLNRTPYIQGVTK